MTTEEKAQYWANRKAGRRGQGPQATTVGSVFPPETWKKVKQIMTRMENEHK